MVCQMSFWYSTSISMTQFKINTLTQAANKSHQRKATMLHCWVLINIHFKLLFVLFRKLNFHMEITRLKYKNKAFRGQQRNMICKRCRWGGGRVGGTYQFHLKAGASPRLTCHHAVEGDGALADEVLADGVMIPHKETHQGQLRHVDRKHQSLLPHRVEPYGTVPEREVVGKGGGEGGGNGGERTREKEQKTNWERDTHTAGKKSVRNNEKRGEVRQINGEERKSDRDGGQREWMV